LRQPSRAFAEHCAAVVTADPSFLCSFMFDFCSIRSFWAHLSRVQLQPRNEKQVIGGIHHVGSELRLCDPDEAPLPEPAQSLHPA
jgi:hypothetical protein